MTFPEAMEAVIDKKTVTKLEWNNPNIYFFLKDGFLRFHSDKGELHVWDVSEGDLIGQDYVELIITEVKKSN